MCVCVYMYIYVYIHIYVYNMYIYIHYHVTRMKEPYHSYTSDTHVALMDSHLCHAHNWCDIVGQQIVAVHCNALQQRTATMHCNNALQQRTATTHCNNTLQQRTATRCNKTWWMWHRACVLIREMGGGCNTLQQTTATHSLDNFKYPSPSFSFFLVL